MRFLCIFVCLSALIGCTRDADAPSEEAAEPTVVAGAAPAAEEVAAEPAPSPEPEAAPEPAPVATVEPDPEAPKNVAAPG